MKKKSNYWEDSYLGLMMRGIFGCVGACVVMCLLLTCFRFSAVKGRSMYSTLDDGEKYLALRHVTQFDYDDIIIFDAPDKDVDYHYIKRVIGLPGDVIEIKDDRVYRNGELLKEDYIYETMEYTQDQTWDVPEGCLFVLGDNRNVSNDSRMYGPVDIKTVYGKAVVFDIPLSKKE